MVEVDESENVFKLNSSKNIFMILFYHNFCNFSKSFTFTLKSQVIKIIKIVDIFLTRHLHPKRDVLENFRTVELVLTTGWSRNFIWTKHGVTTTVKVYNLINSCFWLKIICRTCITMFTLPFLSVFSSIKVEKKIKI